MLEKAKLPPNSHRKKFFPIKKLTDLTIAFDRYSEDGIKMDGVIINNMEKPYIHTEAYKLKDKKYLTNDFLVELMKSKDINSDERSLMGYDKDDAVYKLYVGGNPADFANVNHDIAASGSYQKMLFSLPYYKEQPCEYMVLNQKMIDYVKKRYGVDGDGEIVDTVEKAYHGGYDKCILECAYDDNWRPYPIRYREDKTSAFKAG